MNKYKNDTFIESWSFIREKNEIKTIEASLNSILPIEGLTRIYIIGNNYHFPYIKNWRNKIEEEQIGLNGWISQNEELINKKIPRDMLNENKILEIYKKFR
ncbi:hypothetical protein HF862_04285 [Fusobacterium sp. FSA-380-WT-3A]|nr:hypothetical protein [Fusobacterium sp. FSA-380-WT-3A]